MHPNVAAFTPGDDEGFSIHLIGAVWVVAALVTEAALDSMDEDEAASPNDDVEMDAEVRTLLEQAIPAIAESTPVGDHRTVHWSNDALIDWLREHRPDLMDRLKGHGAQMQLWDFAAQLQNALRVAHASAMRRDAAHWATEVAAANPIPPKATKPVLRDIAWRHMQTVDGRCATKVAVEGIAA